MSVDSNQLLSLFFPRFASTNGSSRSVGWLAPDREQVLYPRQSVQGLRLSSKWLPAPGGYAVASGQAESSLGQLSQQNPDTMTSRGESLGIVAARRQGTTAVPAIPPEAVDSPLATLEVFRQLQNQICNAGLTTLDQICKDAGPQLEELRQSLSNRVYMPVLNQLHALRYQLTTQPTWGAGSLTTSDRVLIFYLDRLTTQTRQAYRARYE